MLEPKRIEPLVNMAVTYAELGFYAKAIKLFEEAYRIDPHFPPLLKNLKILNQANLLKNGVTSIDLKTALGTYTSD